MTRKEIIEKYLPENIDEYFGGGVCGCPFDYPKYLGHMSEHNFDCRVNGAYTSVNCVSCWNTECELFTEHIKVTIVKCNDWQGVYVEGEKYEEDHNIHTYNLIDIINHFLLDKNTVTQIDYEELWVTDDYVEELGLPNKFDEIPENVFIQGDD